MTLKGYTIAVYGYTDDIGTQTYNLELSQRRAEAVRDFLVQTGISPDDHEHQAVSANPIRASPWATANWRGPPTAGSRSASWIRNLSRTALSSCQGELGLRC